MSSDNSAKNGHYWLDTSALARYISLSLPDDVNLVPPVQNFLQDRYPLNTYQLDPNWGGANGGLTPGGPGGAGIRPVFFDGEATYNGFQALLKHELSHGVQGQLAYTLGNCKEHKFGSGHWRHLRQFSRCSSASQQGL